jgi:hypothetical protein
MKSQSKRNSGRKVHGGVLGVMAPKEAERLLMDWVNLSDSPDHRVLKWISSRHPEVFGFIADDKDLEHLIGNVGRFLRLAWDARDARQRDWCIFTARQEYERGRLEAELGTDFGKGIGRELIPGLPELTPAEVAMFYLSRITHRMQYCPNPGCAARYFLRTKKGQKFCSPECADSARKESKRRWWNENRGA